MPLPPNLPDSEQPSEPDPVSPNPSDQPPTFSADTAKVGQVSAYQFQAEFHSGPLPHPATLRELAELYPQAPEVIFEEFRTQSEHRRSMERAVIENGIKLSKLGQWLGAALGALGLVGSFIVVCLGHDWAGVSIAIGCVLAMVTLFVLGRESQKRERLDKAKLRERMRQGRPVREIEQSD